jgi:hypothetical protein
MAKAKERAPAAALAGDKSKDRTSKRAAAESASSPLEALQDLQDLRLQQRTRVAMPWRRQKN